MNPLEEQQLLSNAWCDSCRIPANSTTTQHKKTNGTSRGGTVGCGGRGGRGHHDHDHHHHHDRSPSPPPPHERDGHHAHHPHPPSPPHHHHHDHHHHGDPHFNDETSAASEAQTRIENLNVQLDDNHQGEDYVSEDDGSYETDEEQQQTKNKAAEAAAALVDGQQQQQQQPATTTTGGTLQIIPSKQTCYSGKSIHIFRLQLFI